jgi:hypothetical protein
MSRTARLYAEIREDDQWHPTPSPKLLQGKHVPVICLSLGTPYELYAALVGYEHCTVYPMWHTEPVIPLSELRGFPEDMNAVYRESFAESSGTCRSHLTWFLVQEVIDYPWERKFPPFTGYVKSQYATLFSSCSTFPEDFPENEEIYRRGGEGRTEVSWVESYREFVGCGDWFISELMKLGDPRDVRIVFWLDY